MLECAVDGPWGRALANSYCVGDPQRREQGPAHLPEDAWGDVAAEAGSLEGSLRDTVVGILDDPTLEPDLLYAMTVFAADVPAVSASAARVLRRAAELGSFEAIAACLRGS